MRSSWATGLILPLALLTRVPLAHGEKDRREFRYEMAVDRVAVDVLVENKDGKFVTGLGPEDFEVFEDGKRVQIVDFELRSLVPGGMDLSQASGPVPSDAAQMPAPAGRGRRFIIFVDLLNTGVSAVQELKPALRLFADQVGGGADQILVSVVTPQRRGLVLQDFTNSREQLRKAVGTLLGNGDVDGRELRNERDLYGILYRDKRPNLARTRDSRVLNQMFTEIRQATSVVKDLSGQEFDRTSFALDAVASLVEWVDHVGQEKGRKTVLFFSENVPLRPAQGLYDLINRRIDEYNEVHRAASREQMDPPMFHESGDSDLGPVVRSTVGRLNRFGATVYGIDLRNAHQSSAPDVSISGGPSGRDRQLLSDFEGQQGLIALAADTGGIAYFRRTDLGEVLRSIERDNRTRYFLTYKPPKHKKKKAKFYEIEIRCRLPDLSVRARKGYLD